MKMKSRIAVVVALSIIAVATFGFKALSQIGLAEVDQREGLHVFLLSKPVSKYDYLGTVKLPPIVPNNNMETLVGILIKRVKADYPTANGIIINDWKGDAIKIAE